MPSRYGLTVEASGVMPSPSILIPVFRCLLAVAQNISEWLHGSRVSGELKAENTCSGLKKVQKTAKGPEDPKPPLNARG